MLISSILPIMTLSCLPFGQYDYLFPTLKMEQPLLRYPTLEKYTQSMTRLNLVHPMTFIMRLYLVCHEYSSTGHA